MNLWTYYLAHLYYIDHRLIHFKVLVSRGTISVRLSSGWVSYQICSTYCAKRFIAYLQKFLKGSNSAINDGKCSTSVISYKDEWSWGWEKFPSKSSIMHLQWKVLTFILNFFHCIWSVWLKNARTISDCWSVSSLKHGLRSVTHYTVI